MQSSNGRHQPSGQMQHAVDFGHCDDEGLNLWSGQRLMCQRPEEQSNFTGHFGFHILQQNFCPPGDCQVNILPLILFFFFFWDRRFSFEEYRIFLVCTQIWLNCEDFYGCQKSFWAGPFICCIRVYNLAARPSILFRQTGTPRKCLKRRFLFGASSAQYGSFCKRATEARTLWVEPKTSSSVANGVTVGLEPCCALFAFLYFFTAKNRSSFLFLFFFILFWLCLVF